MTSFRLPSFAKKPDLSFRFDGNIYQAAYGDTIASALLANGVMLMGRSFKYHRPRGPFTAGPEEPNALVTVGEGASAIPNCPATLVRVEDGMVVESQNRWPSLNHDLLAINGRLSRFLGAGFYYKTFMSPRGFWERLYEPAIRKAAGLGRGSDKADPGRFETLHHHCDHLIIGGGEAGKETASQLNGDGILCDASSDEAAMPNEACLHLRRTAVIGAYDHGFFAATEQLTAAERLATGLDERLHLIRAKEVTLATGAQERLVAFDGNDRPGIMLAGAALVYARDHGVAVGRRIILFANHDRAYDALAYLQDQIIAIIDPRATSPAMERAKASGFRVHARSVIEKAQGYRHVASAVIRPGDGGKGIIMPCDAVLVSGGYNPRLSLLSGVGGTTRFEKRIAAFVPDHVPASWRVAGDALGQTLPECLPLFEIKPQKLRRTKAFVDLQGDVTVDDMRMAAQEGYRHIEHAKRYTTHGMGTDQGGTGGLVGAAVLADALGQTLAETGVSRPRPFVRPSSWGALAGPETGAHFKPERRLPLHHWHEANGAVFLKTGLWLRPLYYTSTGETGWEPVLREARAVRACVGVTDVSSLGKIDVQGKDAALFLDRIYANTISSLKPGMTRYGLMLREDGMVFDDGTVARFSPSHFLVSTTTANAAAVLEHMEFHAAAIWPDLDVALTSVSDQWAQLAVAGPNARKVVQQLTQCDLGEAAFPFMACINADLAGIDGRVFRISFSGELAYELAVPSGHATALMNAILAAGAGFGIIPYGLEALSVMRIEKGHVTGTEINGRATADDLGFGRLLKQSGHFIGAALSQRPALRDPARPKLVGIRARQGAAIKGGAVLLERRDDKRAIGHVTAITQSVVLDQWIGLAMLENGRSRIGDVLVAASPVHGESCLVEIASPHHVDPENTRVRK
jgi:methylglutamate dehydrogenase subunit C